MTGQRSARWAVLVALLVGLACGPAGDAAVEEAEQASPAPEAEMEAEARPLPAEVTEFGNMQDSVFTLAQQILERIESEDLDGLMALAVSESEFYHLVWPDLPSSQPGRNLPWEYAWTDLNQKSRNSARRTIDRYGARPFQLMRVEFEDETTDYGSFQVHRDARLVVQDGAGEIRRLDLFGSVLEWRGRFKAFSLVTD